MGAVNSSNDELNLTMKELNYLKAQVKMLKCHFGEKFTKKELTQYVLRKMDESFKNRDVILYNNHREKKITIPIKKFLDYMEKTKPIIAGYGVLYEQHELLNPNGLMLRKFKTERVKEKDKLKIYENGSFEWLMANIAQNTEKTNMNSFYGCSGAPVSRFFNLFTAASTTLTGQLLISNSQQAFEAFNANNVKFESYSEMVNFIYTISNIPYTCGDVDLQLPYITDEMLYENLVDRFKKYDKKYESRIKTLIVTLTQHEKAMVYFRNNLFAFSATPYIKNKLLENYRLTQKFMNPIHPPEDVEERINELWEYYLQYVYFPQAPIGAARRLNTEKRKSVVLVDTDSNMVTVADWVDFSKEMIEKEDPSIFNTKDEDNMDYVIVNTISRVLTKMVNTTFHTLATNSNIREDKIPLLNMKNEYLFPRKVLGTTKKRYANITALKEGKFMNNAVSVAGMDFMKSTTREETKQVMMDIVEKEMLLSNDIDVRRIRKKLNDFAEYIKQTLLDGEKSYLIPGRFKDPEAYKAPYSEQPVRAALAWNYTYPYDQINYDEDIDILHVNMGNVEDISGLETTHPEIYKGLLRVYNNSNPDISSKGITVFAIPRNQESIPEWIRPYINVDKIVNTNISRADPLLNSLEMMTCHVKNLSYATNIKTIG